MKQKEGIIKRIIKIIITIPIAKIYLNKIEDCEEEIEEQEKTYQIKSK